MRLIRRGVVVSATCIGLLALWASPASAQVDVERVYTGGRPPAVGSVLVPRGQTTAVLVPGGQRTAPGSELAAARALRLRISSGEFSAASQSRVGGLAFTGADLVSLVLFALFAVTLGMILTRRARPRSSP